jgi:hypothetical protein
MGREIRRVPPNWEHPKDENGDYKSLHDWDYETAGREWLENCIAWENGTYGWLQEHPEEKEETPFYWDWDGGPPDPDYCRPKFEEEPTWYQMYETVSEGSPVTPPFETKEELLEYLVEYGTFWDQMDGKGGWDREIAQRFVDSGYASSMIVTISSEGHVDIKTPRDGS